MGDAGGHARVASEKDVHAILVASQDDNEVVTPVLHHLQQYLDRFLAIVALVFRAIQVVGLIDEQNAAHRLFQHLLGLRRRVADVLADKIVTRHRHHVVAANVAEAVENFRHALCDRGFSSTGIAGEAHVQRGWFRLQAHAASGAFHQKQCRHFTYAGFYRDEAHQVPIQSVDHIADVALLVEILQVDGLRGWYDLGIHAARRCAGTRSSSRRMAPTTFR